MNVSNKVSIPVLAGAVITCGFWALSYWGHVSPPAEVSSGATIIVMALLGYLVPHGGSDA